MVEADGNEGVDRPPDADYFGDELATRGAEDTGEAHEPVSAYGAKKDLVPVGGNLCGWVGLDVGGERGRREGKYLFFSGEGHGFFSVGVGFEDAAVWVYV